MRDRKKRVNCGLRIGIGYAGGANQHCHQRVTDTYHGILVCHRHYRELLLVGPKPIMSWTWT